MFFLSFHLQRHQVLCLKFIPSTRIPQPQLISPNFTTLSFNTLSSSSTSLFYSRISVDRGILKSTISICLYPRPWTTKPPPHLPHSFLHHHRSSICFRRGRFLLLLLRAEENDQPYMPYRRSHRL